MHKNAANLYNTLLAIYFNEYNNFTDEWKDKINKKYNPSNFFVKGHKYDEWYKKDEEKNNSQTEETIAEIVN